MKATLTLEIEFDPELTDAESVAGALDTLLDTAMSTPGILDEYGNPGVDEFLVADELIGQARELLAHPDIDDAHHNLRVLHKLLGVPIPDYLD